MPAVLATLQLFYEPLAPSYILVISSPSRPKSVLEVLEVLLRTRINGIDLTGKGETKVKNSL